MTALPTDPDLDRDGRPRFRWLSARTVTIKLRHYDFTTITRSATRPQSTDAPRLLAEIDASAGIRLLGVGATTPADFVQDDLFGTAAGDERASTPDAGRRPRRTSMRVPLWYGQAEAGTKGDQGVTQSAIEVRRLVGKIVLFLVLCWVVVLISGISGAAQGAEFKPLNIVMAILPGCAFVPAAYFAVKLHLTSDPEVLGQIWPKTLAYGAAGLVLLIASAYAVYQMGQ